MREEITLLRSRGVTAAGLFDTLQGVLSFYINCTYDLIVMEGQWENLIFIEYGKIEFELSMQNNYEDKLQLCRD